MSEFLYCHIHPKIITLSFVKRIMGDDPFVSPFSNFSLT